MALLSLFALLPLLLFAPPAFCQNFTRQDFPPDFVFGAGTSAFQYEGALAEDGRTPSILDDIFNDTWLQPDKSKVIEAADGYHRYKEDVKLMMDTSLEAYRFSISWSRLIPYGRGAVNTEGFKYYSNVLDELAKQGITAHVTLNHLDLPQVLQDEYGGWLSPKIVNDFREFADVCFREFGNKVSHWTTMNEPNVNGLIETYREGFGCSLKFGISYCLTGNSSDRVYITVHNMLIAHSETVRLYRTRYQHSQGGRIGLTAYSFWCQPFSNAYANVEATRRVKIFLFDWVLSPIVYGDYPEAMKKIASTRLPSFTKPQKEALKGSFDFIAINYYTAVYISDNSNISKAAVQSFQTDVAATMRIEKKDPPSSGPFLPTHVPKDFSGLRKMLQYLRHCYSNPPIYIHENGFAMGVDDALNDTARVAYLKGYIGSTLEAIRDGADVRGYFVWSFIDVFEFLGGYKKGYGLYHVDFDDEERPRTPKLSARWYSNFLKSNMSAAFNVDNARLESLPFASQ